MTRDKYDDPDIGMLPEDVDTTTAPDGIRQTTEENHK